MYQHSQNVRVAKTVYVNGTIRNEKDFVLGGSTAINDIVWIDDDDTGKWLVLKIDKYMI